MTKKEESGLRVGELAGNPGGYSGAKSVDPYEPVHIADEKEDEDEDTTAPMGIRAVSQPGPDGFPR